MCATSPLYWLAKLYFFRDVVETECDPFGFLASGVGSKDEYAIGNVGLNARCGKPAPLIESFFQGVHELAVDGNMLAFVAGGVFFEQPGPLVIKLDAQTETAGRVDHLCFFNIGLGQKWFFADGKPHRVFAKNRDGFGSSGRVGIHLRVQMQGAERVFGFALLGLTSACHDGQEDPQIDIESMPSVHHSAPNKRFGPGK